MKKSVWLSYDLGVTGDYEGLYAWLDDKNAKECGDSVATFSMDVNGAEDVFEKIGEQIKEFVDLGKRARIYAFCREGKIVKGKFLIGHRRTAPWEGYGTHDDQEEDSEA